MKTKLERDLLLGKIIYFESEEHHLELSYKMSRAKIAKFYIEFDGIVVHTNREFSEIKRLLNVTINKFEMGIVK